MTSMEMDSVKESAIKPQISFYNQLKLIYENLIKAEVASMKFLCSDFLPAGKLENITDGRELFQVLVTLGRISSENMCLVIALLDYVGRKDILFKYKWTDEDVRVAHSKSLISPYRLLLRDISDNLLADDLEIFKFLLSDFGLSSSAVDKIENAESFILTLERNGKLSSEDFTILEKLLTAVSKLHLVKRINDFRDGRTVAMVSQDKVTAIAVTPCVMRNNNSTNAENNVTEEFNNLRISGVQNQSNNVVSDREAVANSINNNTSHDLPPTAPVLQNTEDPSKCYTMTKPGYCLIINNVDFDPGHRHGTRYGSDVDAASLFKLFEEKLKFKVKYLENGTLGTMNQTLLSVREEIDRDGGKYDCFVCCVLSHGKNGIVYSVDNRELKINDMMVKFKKTVCPGMKNKPKVFFMQACQGARKEVYTDSSVDNVDDEEQKSLESDDTEVDMSLLTIPSERDFLLAYSAVPGYASFRHREDGTFFIKTLVELIEQHHNSIDLMRILTMVTDKVSSIKMEYDSNNTYCQCPAPINTLTKLLYWKS